MHTFIAVGNLEIVIIVKIFAYNSVHPPLSSHIDDFSDSAFLRIKTLLCWSENESNVNDKNHNGQGSTSSL